MKNNHNNAKAVARKQLDMDNYDRCWAKGACVSAEDITNMRQYETASVLLNQKYLDNCLHQFN